jgi:hypothetical protein
MVNSNSLVFNYSEKIGFIIGKAIRYVVIGGIIYLIGGKLGGSNPTTPPPTLPTS